MANQQITDMVQATGLGSDDDFTLVQSGINKKVQSGILSGFDDYTALLADTVTVYDTGTILRTKAEGIAYEVAAPGAVDHHEATVGGVKLYEVGNSFTVLVRLTDAVARPVVYREGATVHVAGDHYVFLDDGNTDIVGLTGWKLDPAYSGAEKTKLATLSTITVQDEGTPLATTADTFNFVGPGVTASGTAGTKTITISGVAAGGGTLFTYATRVEAIASPPASPAPGDVMVAGGYEYVFVTGSTMMNDKTGISTLNGWQPLGQWYARHFGIVGDGDGLGGGTDDTAVINTVCNNLGQGDHLKFDADPVTGARFYEATAILLDSVTMIYCEIEFDVGVRLYGRATSAELALLEIKGIQNATFTNLTFDSDGSAVTSVFQPNYEGALRISSQFTGVDGYLITRPSQWLKFNGGQTRNFRRGHIFGKNETEVKQAAIAQSEITFHNHSFRGVNGCVVMNAELGFVEYTASMLVAQQFEASNSWWVDADGFIIKQGQDGVLGNDSGGVMVNGGEGQRGISDGYGLYGQQIWISPGTVCEWAATNYVTGDMEILNTGNSFFGPQTHTWFKIAPGATGRLIATGTWEKNVAGGRAGLLVDAGEAPEFDYTLDLDCVDFRWDENDVLIVGGRPDIRKLAIRKSSANPGGDEITTGVPKANAWDYSVASPNGEAMSTSLDATPKDGWTQAVGIAGNLEFGRSNAALPPGQASSIRFTQFNLQVAIATATGTGGIFLRGDETVIKFKAKEVTASSVFFGIQLQYYDHTGFDLGTAADRFGVDATAIAALSLDDDWQQFILPIDRPDNARYVRVVMRGPTTGDTDFQIADLQFA